MIIASVGETSEAPLEPRAFSLGDDPTWSLLEPSGNPPRGREPIAVVYDSLGERLIFTNGEVVNALELEGAPEWHTFCPLGTPRSLSSSTVRVALVSDGLFVDVGGDTFRFDLATPYCD